MGVTSETHEQKPEEAVILETVTETTPQTEPEEINFTDSLPEQHIQDRDDLYAMFVRVGEKLKVATTYQEVDDALLDEGYDKTGEGLLNAMSRLHFEKHEREMLAEFTQQEEAQGNTVENQVADHTDGPE